MARKIQKHEVDYIIWQNRTTEFYLSARLLYLSKLYSGAAFCGFQAIESLMKATLVYWDKSFKPEQTGHKIASMIRTIRNKARNAKGFSCPQYFYSDQRYQKVTRYPVSKKGVLIPNTFLDDLDQTIHNLIKLVPFQFNSELIHAVSGKTNKALNILRRKNKQMKSLRKTLGVSLIKKKT